MLSLQLHVLLALVMHGQPLVTEDLLQFRDLGLLRKHLLLLGVRPLQSETELLRLLLPLHALLLKRV